MEPSELAAVAGRYRDMIYRVALVRPPTGG